MKHVSIFDSTLRDGAQGVDISFSVNDKIAITHALDDFGVGYIEAGNPGSNPKDIEFFEIAKTLKLKNSKLVAFGSTCRKDTGAASDPTIAALIEADTPAVAIFGKTWDLHVTDIIGTTLERNLEMISDSVAYVKARGKEVIFDSEHFFDGFKANKQYAFNVLTAAKSAGADVLCLCDTNGGTMPNEVYDIVSEVAERFPDTVLGIHAHNDTGCAVANSVISTVAGVTHIQGTFIGIGERCGNADLSSIIPSVELKLKNDVDGDIAKLSETASKIAEIANTTLSGNKPYVGANAFSHKGGMHIDGVIKNSVSFEHIDPAVVGNTRRFVLSEVAGRGSILEKAKHFAPDLKKDDPRLSSILSRLKELEHEGYQFEAADASFELLARRILETFTPAFRLVMYKTISDYPEPAGEQPSSAVVKIEVDGKEEITAAQGKGPVHALDNALRRALAVFYPEIADMKLIDYKVRVLDQKSATAAKVRVLVESADQHSQWTTIGVSNDIIEASLTAIVDSIEYKLLKR